MTTPETKTGLDALVAMATALADASMAAVAVMESMQQFVDAHKAATTAGHGVLVIRRPDGTITTTAAVHLEAGTALFMDEPGPIAIPAIKFEAMKPHAADVAPYRPHYVDTPGIMFTHNS